MIDVATKERLRLMPNDYAGPYLRVSVDQLPRVRQVLEQHKVSYWDDGFSTKIGDRPAIVYVNFGHKGKARADEIQTLLDSEG